MLTDPYPLHADQGQPWAKYNEAGTLAASIDSVLWYMQREVGGDFYYSDVSEAGIVDQYLPQTEIRANISPTGVIPGVSWYLPQNFTSAIWDGGGAPDYLGSADGWKYDGPPGNQGVANGFNADLVQELNEEALFHVDAPGPPMLDRGSNLTYARVDKFEHWVEVQIGGLWYVCSDPLPWRNIMHLQCKDPVNGWTPDLTQRNEILEGWLPSMSGFSGTFPQNP